MGRINNYKNRKNKRRLLFLITDANEINIRKMVRDGQSGSRCSLSQGNMLRIRSPRSILVVFLSKLTVALALASSADATRFGGCDTEMAGCTWIHSPASSSPSHIQCNPTVLFEQHKEDRLHIAATFDRAHPAQTYLLDPNPFPPHYITLANISARTAVALQLLPLFDYCYRVERLAGYNTDLMGLVRPARCGDKGALESRGFLLSYRNAFVNLHGNEYMNSLQVCMEDVAYI